MSDNQPLRQLGRPRANRRAYRIIAGDYNGWLQGDEFWTIEEWYRQERRRRTWRTHAARRKAARNAT